MSDYIRREDAINAIKELPSADIWIPCSERLPDDDIKVLVTDEDGDIYIAYYDYNEWSDDPCPYQTHIQRGARMNNLTNAEANALLKVLETAELRIKNIEEMVMLANAYNKLMAICEGKKEEPKPKPAKKEIDRGKIVALRDAGWEVKDIAGEMHCSAQTIYNVLNEAKQKG